MTNTSKTNSEILISLIEDSSLPTVGITSSPSDTHVIPIDIIEESRAKRILGQMVFTVSEEAATNPEEAPEKVLVVGQIISVQTKNRWHEDVAFKGVIKMHGQLPHLSGRADIRIAQVSVQSCYRLKSENPKGDILGMSLSTGEPVREMTDDVMTALVKEHEKAITYIGKVYGTDVNLPMWFKHFDKNAHGEEGAGDAYHIGVFGKTGSGKTVTASMMLLGYAKNKQNMNILVLDPQGQFHLDKELLPSGKKLEVEVGNAGMKHQKFKILDDICLPKDDFQIFATLLQKNDFIRNAFGITTLEKETDMANAIAGYLERWASKSQGGTGGPRLDSLYDDAQSQGLMKEILGKFAKRGEGTGAAAYSEDLRRVYSTVSRMGDIVRNLESILEIPRRFNDIWERYWRPVTSLFSGQRPDGSQKKTMEAFVALIASKESKGNFIVLDMSRQGGHELGENLQAMFVKMIQKRLVEIGGDFFIEGRKVNCLVVMDEAHRFISDKSGDAQIRELTAEIVDAVRTTRKYGIGYMLITQTIESLHEEILGQMRIFAFGYGLTTGTELKKVSQTINNKDAEALYRSFIDPSSSKRYPFMVCGPISPLSSTGAPLFLEVYTDFKDFK